MAGAVGGLRVQGLSDLTRSLKKISREAGVALRAEMMKQGEPVKETAEQKAGADITNIGPTWWHMRVGATTSVVYVAPATRRHGGSPRPNFGVLLMTRSLEPALVEHEEEIVHGAEDMLDKLFLEAGFI